MESKLDVNKVMPIFSELKWSNGPLIMYRGSEEKADYNILNIVSGKYMT